MRFKKFAAVLLSAALTLSLFAGCCNESLLELLLNLLQDQYQNITITAEEDLEAALRQAVSQNDSVEEIDSALQETLLPTVSFESLRSARAGDQTFDLVFRTGGDAEAVARQTYTDWNTIFGSLPSGGRYLADLATLKADNGYYILVNVTVQKGGSSSGSGSGSHDGGDDGDDDDGSANPPAPPAGETYDVGNIDELNQLMADHPGEDFADDTIRLASGTYTITEELLESFAGTLTVQEGADVTVQLEGTNLFGTIAKGGAVDGIDFVVTRFIKAAGNIGAVAAQNAGTIQNCTVTIQGGKYIQGTGNVGGVAGENSGAIRSTSVTFAAAGGNSAILYGMDGYTGGIAGVNTAAGTIQGCTVEGSQGRINGTAGKAGALAGQNLNTKESVAGSFSGVNLTIPVGEQA